MDHVLDILGKLQHDSLIAGLPQVSYQPLSPAMGPNDIIHIVVPHIELPIYVADSDIYIVGNILRGDDKVIQLTSVLANNGLIVLFL